MLRDILQALLFHLVSILSLFSFKYIIKYITSYCSLFPKYIPVILHHYSFISE